MMNFKIVIRSIFKEKLKFLLIIVGLAVGFSGFLILQLLISIELNYDTFHNDYENIYRIITETKNSEGEQRITLLDGGSHYVFRKGIWCILWYSVVMAAILWHRVYFRISVCYSAH